MPALEFCLPPGELSRLLRMPPFARRGARAVPFECVWHDTAAADLAANRLSLCHTRQIWRLERGAPDPAEAWAPGTPSPLLAEAAEPAALGAPVSDLATPLMPLAGFHGRQRTIRLADGDPASLWVVEGALRSVAEERPVCRLVLHGPVSRLLELSGQLAASLPVAVPRSTMAVEALAMARGTVVPHRRSGGPEVPPDATVSDAIALVIGHLTDVLLDGVPGILAGGSPEPVHAMRVALRRLRSAMSVFRRAADGPAFAAVKDPLHELAAALGAARDWDVFLMGTAQEVAAAFGEDRRIATMLAAAEKQRIAAYDGLRRVFAAAEFRQLAVALVQLAALRPWEMDADAERLALLQEDASAYAAGMLSKRYQHMLAPGQDISGLPVEELHALRKQGKRLRYAAEFFAPLNGRRNTRRFVRRVSDLQEALGHLNDGAAAAGLMKSLRGGPDRQFAAGAVQGFAAARNADARSKIARSWTKFRRVSPFWS